jgi:hypothetical protein
MNRIILLSMLLLTACGLGTIDPTTDAEQSSKEKPSDLDPAEGWSSADSPTLFSDELEYKLADLPEEGEATNIPWASSYWPVYQDSINKRWNGSDTLSPAAKYGEAFGVSDIEDKVSRAHGIEKYKSRTACTTTSDCDSDMAESCAIRDGEEDGYCIPTWWGICHAWAPVAIMELEPEQPVTRNGVEFKVNDIKALATLAYNRTFSKFVSLRCNENDSADEIEYDEYNRPTGSDEECRDTNPGTYHILLTNYLGLKGESFVEDRTMDYQVWNQPLRSYTVREMEAVTVVEAHELLDVPDEENEDDSTESGPDYDTDFGISGSVDGKGWVDHGPYPVDGATKVTVKMTGEGGDADLYVRIDSAPTSTKYDCRPYTSGSDEECVVEVPEDAEELFIAVSEYANTDTLYDITVDIELPTSPTASGGSDELAYIFNEDAVELYYVEMDVKYISESRSSTDGNLSDRIDSYTHTDHYRYILEVDGDGMIIGGEWVGSSKRNHPDFLWLPTGRSDWPQVAEGAIQWDLVKDLIDSSMIDNTPEVDESSNDAGKLVESFDLDQGAWKHFGPFQTDGVLHAAISGTGDADIYVREGSQPTSSSHDCRPYKSSSNEECMLEGPGEFYVSVHGYLSSSVELEINWGSAESGEEPTVEEASEHLDESGEVEFQEMALYVLNVEAGQSVKIQTGSEADVDLYARLGNPPTTSQYDKRAYTYSGDETIEFTASSAGTLHIGVHGWEAAEYTLVTSDN